MFLFFRFSCLFYLLTELGLHIYDLNLAHRDTLGVDETDPAAPFIKTVVAVLCECVVVVLVCATAQAALVKFVPIAFKSPPTRLAT